MWLTRKIAVGQTFADITTTIRLSNDYIKKEILLIVGRD